MNKLINKLRILGSGFTEDEYNLYRFDLLDNPDDAMRFISNRLNHCIFQPAVNRGYQQHVLEDKWITHHYLTSMRLPVPRTYGLYHPVFGETPDGKPLTEPDHVAELLETELPVCLFLKPRGGRKGSNVIRAELHKSIDGHIEVSAEGIVQQLDMFLQTLPQDAFGYYAGCYHGWLLQGYIPQHGFLNRINPHTINTLRIITFIDSQDNIQIQHAILRLGRQGGTADNWEKGGLSVAIDHVTGRLGRGVFKPQYSGAWASEHPDTGICFEGLILPEWSSVLDTCRRAAALFSGTRTVGWDIALSTDGPVIIEGNSDWGVPSVQVHTSGYLTDSVRRELVNFGVKLPDRAKSLPMALVALLVYQWRRSRAPRLLNALHERIRNPFRVT